MAGNTTNANLLAALNQTIKAINDMTGGTTVVEAPNVTVRPVININCSCGSTGGTKLPDSPVDGTDTPPDGYEPDPNTIERQCKAAYYVYDALYGIIDDLRKQQVDKVQTATLALFTGLTLALIGTSMAPVVGTIAGAGIGIAVALFTMSVDAGEILTAMNNRKSDIVCAFNNAGNTTEAKDELLAIMAEEGMNGLAYIEFMGYFLVADTLRVLFQAVDWVSESTIAGYAGASAGCGGCGGYSCGSPGTFVLHDPRYSNVGDYTANYIGENTVVITTGYIVPGYGSRFSFRFGSNLESRQLKHAEVVGTMSGDTATGYASLLDNTGGDIYLWTDGSFSSSQLNTITDLYTSQNAPICVSAINGSYISPGTILEFEFFPV